MDKRKCYLLLQIPLEQISLFMCLLTPVQRFDPAEAVVCSGFAFCLAEACLQLDYHTPHHASQLIVHLNELLW